MPPQDPQNPNPPQSPVSPVTTLNPSQPTTPPEAAPVGQPAAVPPTLVESTGSQKDKNLSLAFGILSIVGLVAGFFLGYAALLFAFLGVVGAQKAKKINYTPGLALGAVGAILNAIAYLLALTILRK